MNIFSLEKNRFHQKACENKKKRQSVNSSSQIKNQQIDNFIEQKAQSLQMDLDLSYTKASDQDSFKLNHIPKSVRANLIGQLNNKYGRRSLQ
ncbi:unnamed protein product (macronuclear) [Paramecium tetraurelia]|uniref:Uncharacterized protein n=1 Tax=Paramecium tetraurelia TaxID=5888 RepID=A0C6L0_PARTE|nr:uncharacterized protein GSPATT00035556001 [Paramecium tetraurelia]CAK66427.1 unnamed protein product [Paramecium tetraurelia]|eukprot:XP_001433824.1 hypothetical protein (macronuclear) [Paramecium tetraurelia strain d4-2]